MRPHVVGIHTPLLGNKIYSEMLRRSFESSSVIRYDAHWSTEEQERDGGSFVGRQVERLSHKSWERLRANNLQFWTLRYELGTSYWGRRTLNTILRGGRPDALHFHSQNVALLSLDVIRKIPSVISCDTTSYRMGEQRLAPEWRWTFRPSHAVERVAFHAASAVVAFSEWAAESIVIQHGLPARRVHVIPPGVDVESFAPVVERPRRAAGAPLRLLFVGGEFERKGGPQLLALFLERFAHTGMVELHIVTRDPIVSPHPAVVIHRGIEAFTEPWFTLYADADIFVLPTTFDQAPIAYLEAMAAGLPIVTTRVGAAPEIVLDGETGFVVAGDQPNAFGDRIDQLIASSEMRRAFAESALKRVARRYSSKRNAARLEELLGRVAASPTKG